MIYVCLKLVQEMNSAFDYYHSILIPISDKIIMSLDVKISEAIMYFQENGYAIKEKVFERCGEPNPITQISKRPRRSAVPDFMDDIIFDDNVPKEAINAAVVPPVPRYVHLVVSCCACAFPASQTNVYILLHFYSLGLNKKIWSKLENKDLPKL